MSTLSIYLLNYSLSFGIEELWNHIASCFSTDRILKNTEVDITLYKVLKNANLGSDKYQNDNKKELEESSGCLIIGDGIRMSYLEILKDARFYKSWIKNGK